MIKTCVMTREKLFKILDAEEYTGEELQDADYLFDRIETVYDWEEVSIDDDEIIQLVGEYQISKL
jgi:hypothetical protein